MRKRSRCPSADDAASPLRYICGKSRILEGKVSELMQRCADAEQQLQTLMGVFLFIDVDRVAKEVNKHSSGDLHDRVIAFSSIIDTTCAIPCTPDVSIPVEEVDQQLPGTLESDYEASWTRPGNFHAEGDINAHAALEAEVDLLRLQLADQQMQLQASLAH